MAEGVSTKDARPAEILLVEDEMTSGQLATTTLRGAGHNVRWVRSARDARAHLRERLPDLLILDLTLEIDGLELLQALRFSPSDPRGGIVVLTEPGDTRGRERAHQLGAAAVLAKPIRGPELADAVNELASWL
jgi:DNA-binding response OmpR family regulator